ncbi:MAG: transcriptional repressor [Deltaproteobacteria bacterium]|nr:transcriptional repressor [Deltaproteobacteria bacterium]
MDEIQTFRQYIKQKGLRNTPEREMIIREIFSLHDHFDVDELFLRLRNKKKVISKASIYRTIPLLIESGLIKEVYFEDGHFHYEHIYGHRGHSHLRCACCGRIVEFPEDEIVELGNRIGGKYGFAITSYRFELLGYCPQCLARGRAGRDCRPPGKVRLREGAGAGGSVRQGAARGSMGVDER